MTDMRSYSYLNLDLAWPNFTLVNLDKHPDGSLTLAQHPALIETVGADIAQEALAQGAPSPMPAGIAVTPDCGCNLYIADPARHRIWCFDTCVGTPVPLRCLGGPGTLPGEVNTPRGLAIVDTPSGQHLYIADSGNHRIQVIDIQSQQPLAVWGQPQPYLPPTAGDGPGRLNDPWDLAVDAAGSLYVVDHGNRRVQKFLKTGHVDETFWEAAQAAPLHEPTRIAIAAGRIYILDRQGTEAQIVIANTTGVIEATWSVAEPLAPTTLAVTATALYIGGQSGLLVKYTLDGQRLGVTDTHLQPLAALVAGCDDTLLAGVGGLPLSRLAEDQGYAPAGSFYGGPFNTVADVLAWHRLQVHAESLDANTYLQLFTATSTGTGVPVVVDGDSPFGAGWFALPRNETDVLVLGETVRRALAAGSGGNADSLPVTTSIWIGGVLRGDGSSTPVVRQMRLDFNPETLIRYLPATYREGAQRRLVLELLLATLGNDLAEAEDILHAMPAYFDPAAAPPAWLPWLSGWLDFNLVEDWAPEVTRRNLAGAMELYSRRGTVAGLQRYLETYAGVKARIEEPRVALFGLNDDLALGFNTVLAPAHEQGAVLGSTATLGQSHLLPAEEMGVPVFEDVAHRFAVHVYAAEVADPATEQAILDILDREKPAHTTYHLCLIEARMRIGFQARIGIDSIVAGPARALRVGDLAALGQDTVLADSPHRANGRLGDGIRVGAPLS